MKIRPIKLRLTAILLIIATALILGRWLFTSPSSRDGRSFLSRNPSATDPAPSEETKTHPGHKRQRPADSGDLAHIKERWRAMAPSMKQMGQVSSEQFEARDQLARDSIQSLLCSRETLELAKYIKELEIPSGGTMLDDAVAELMRSDRAAEARASLISLLDGPEIEAGDHLVTLTSHRETWSFEAGKGCTDEEFKEFFAAMKDEKCAFNAMLGRNLALADTDPRQAITFTLEVLKDHNNLIASDMSLSGQVNKLPLDSDFSEIEKLFPVDSPENRTDYSPVWSAYTRVFYKWAEKDPVAVANHIMENPERTGPAKIAIVAEAVAHRDPLAALDWVKTIPHGPFFDHAASGIMSSINDNYPDQALELASKISDAKLREEAINQTTIKKTRAERDRQN